MRSVFVYTRPSARAKVIEFLNEHYLPSGDSQWTDSKACWLKISDNRDEFESDETAAISVAVGSEDFFCVMADISGRIDGKKEATDLCVAIMEHVGGVAYDDYSSHLWTLDELIQNKTAYGLPFFDSAGWYKRYVPEKNPAPNTDEPADPSLEPRLKWPLL